ncbi:DUF402 domain-containing protein [Tengunoibacter tsumagoiensis]|uniref:DUF402 domain-containing protein n=1 Tax=Tengunoibacter tsumagoiensis TaxID=2014871 RepID=A0A401ZX05_9CHLR|nr:DUF402 domain-containing protein [Tengunoibacter tsumagoiensis]GCE11274.1 hypothetical protein KTT_11330 [Tengunoibacter tsumagoiensis]
MSQEFRIESRSYDQLLRGSWQAQFLEPIRQLGDEQMLALEGAMRFWLPAGNLMYWASGTRPLRSNCLQIFWPERWYMLSAFYNEDRLIHTYATIIQPVQLLFNQLSYIDLDLSILVKPDLSYEVLTQAEFEHMAETLGYSEETSQSALTALRALTSSLQRSIGVFSAVPYRINLTNIPSVRCGDN